MIELSKRESEIFKALVEIYCETARPVGSRTISEKLNISFSPASVRSILASLEEKGFLEKPHTSAGRVPTVEGYRFYVARLMCPARLDLEEKAEIESAIVCVRSDTYELLEGVSKAISRLSKQLGIIVEPFGEELILFRVNCIPISRTTVFIVVSTTSGMVRSVPLEFPREIDYRRLYAVLDLINERLGGRTLGEITANIERRFADVVNIREVFLMRFINSAEDIFHFDCDESLHYYGTSQLLEKPEFQRSSDLRKIVLLLEDKTNLTRLLAISSNIGSFEIRVGGPIEDISVAKCSYNTKNSVGTIGIVGPLRMDYGKVVSVLTFASSLLSASFRK